ncbi:hypothetical protein VTK73DRAFT_1312 [Phialemonium thermophilum]|uniref:Uncharacterized protein n=1 Tax=Phialemonium thermophilum TaxID=223376 RepID=A0ABR3VTL6_9PEZI
MAPLKAWKTHRQASGLAGALPVPPSAYSLNEEWRIFYNDATLGAGTGTVYHSWGVYPRWAWLQNMAVEITCLWQAFETVRNAQRVLEQKEAAAKELTAKLRTEMLEKLVAQQTGLPAAEALNRHYPAIAQFNPQFLRLLVAAG